MTIRAHACLKCGEVFLETAFSHVPAVRHGEKSLHWHCGAQAVIRLVEGDSLYGIPLGLRVAFSPEKICTVENITAHGDPKHGNANIRFDDGTTDAVLWWLPELAHANK